MPTSQYAIYDRHLHETDITYTRSVCISNSALFQYQIFQRLPLESMQHANLWTPAGCQTSSRSSCWSSSLTVRGKQSTQRQHKEIQQTDRQTAKRNVCFLTNTIRGEQRQVQATHTIETSNTLLPVNIDKWREHSSWHRWRWTCNLHPHLHKTNTVDITVQSCTNYTSYNTFTFRKVWKTADKQVRRETTSSSELLH